MMNDTYNLRNLGLEASPCLYPLSAQAQKNDLDGTTDIVAHCSYPLFDIDRTLAISVQKILREPALLGSSFESVRHIEPTGIAFLHEKEQHEFEQMVLLCWGRSGTL